MFTGIIEQTGTVKKLCPAPGGLALTVDLGQMAEATKIGDSIAVNGTCLTISNLAGSLANFDISSETVQKTTLGKLKPASIVNLEPAIKADARFGGHFVQGHVDGIATLKSIQKKGHFAEIKFTCPANLLDEILPKGAVAVDGISLTVADMDNQTFTVALIPQTLETTTLNNLKPGDSVNIETDLIVKAVKDQLKKILPDTRSLTVEKLRQSGF